SRAVEARQIAESFPDQEPALLRCRRELLQDRNKSLAFIEVHATDRGTFVTRQLSVWIRLSCNLVPLHLGMHDLSINGRKLRPSNLLSILPPSFTDRMEYSDVGIKSLWHQR